MPTMEEENKEWCGDNDVYYEPSVDVPELFIDLLREGREKDYEGYYR